MAPCNSKRRRGRREGAGGTNLTQEYSVSLPISTVPRGALRSASGGSRSPQAGPPWPWGDSCGGAATGDGFRKIPRSGPLSGGSSSRSMVGSCPSGWICECSATSSWLLALWLVGATRAALRHGCRMRGSDDVATLRAASGGAYRHRVVASRGG